MNDTINNILNSSQESGVTISLVKPFLESAETTHGGDENTPDFYHCAKYLISPMPGVKDVFVNKNGLYPPSNIDAFDDYSSAENLNLHFGDPCTMGDLSWMTRSPVARNLNTPEFLSFDDRLLINRSSSDQTVISHKLENSLDSESDIRHFP